MSKDQVRRPAITVVLTGPGGKRMLELTRQNLGKHAVIYIDSNPHSVPMINGPVSDRFVITGMPDDIRRIFQKLAQP